MMSQVIQGMWIITRMTEIKTVLLKFYLTVLTVNRTFNPYLLVIKIMTGVNIVQ